MTESSCTEKKTITEKILIIDDDFLVLNALDYTLRREGYETIKAQNGLEALAILKGEPIALIICDQRMPSMSGLEVLQQAQQIQPGAIRIALTGNADRETVVDAINVGHVYQFLSKPWDDAVLYQTISGAIEKYRLSEENQRLQQLLLLQNLQLEKTNSLLSYERNLGARIHERLLLGKAPKDIPGLAFSAATVPSKEIDGDFFDFYQSYPHTVDVVIGDVMGKGIPSALVGIALKTQLQRFGIAINHIKYCDKKDFWWEDLLQTNEILMRTHQEIAKQLLELEFFVSLFYGRFDLKRKTFSYVDCGSPKPIHYQAKKKATLFLRGCDFPIGTVEKNEYHEFSVPFDDGDIFVFYSNGVIETKAPSGEIYGLDRLTQTVQKFANESSEALLEQIRSDVIAHSERGHVDDDLTFVIVKTIPTDQYAYHSLSAVYLNDLSQLNAVRSFVKRICDNAPGEADSLNQALELAIDEAFCNIVKHAYKEAGQTIYLRAQYQPEGLWLELSDQGECFNPQNISEPSLIGEGESGYGLFIIRQITDKIAYLPKTSADGWNHLRIYKRYIFKEVPMEFTHTIQDKILIVTPTGSSLDAREAREFKDKIIELINTNATHTVVIDMHNLQFIDSSGLGTFLSILKTLHVKNGELKLCNLNKSIRTIFELVSMHKIFEIYNTIEEAILSFKT